MKGPAVAQFRERRAQGAQGPAAPESLPDPCPCPLGLSSIVFSCCDPDLAGGSLERRAINRQLSRYPVTTWGGAGPLDGNKTNYPQHFSSCWHQGHLG